MGQLHVLIENDRLLTPGSHNVPIPTIETGPEKGDSPHLPERPGGSFAQMGTVPFFRMGRRYAVIENAGRDEVAVESNNLREMEPLGNRQKEWTALRGILGREPTMAYLVVTDAREPRLAFHTESHATVTTVKAHIGLSETTLMVDDNGAYRGQVVLRMDNATEQFLEIRLPEGARLWTARVAGEAVKPTDLPGATSLRDVRIPLIKTACGDLYYEVVLKYGGKMPALGTVGSVEFPLVRCMNITPDLSQVRLFVPADNQWFDFGGTMRVAEEADLRADYLKFQTKQAEQNLEALRRGDKWTKICAETSLKAQQGVVQEYRSSISLQDSNGYLQSELAANDSANKEAVQEIEKQEKAPAEGEVQYNRERLNMVYQAQQTSRARNVVNDVGSNWGDTVEQKPAADTTRQFNEAWIKQNSLRPPIIVQEEEEKIEGQKAGVAYFGRRIAFGHGGGQGKANVVANAANAPQQPSAAQVFHVAPQSSTQGMPQIGDFAAAVQPQGNNYQYQQAGQYDNQSQTVQSLRSDNNSEALQRYQVRRNQQLGLAGAYTKGMPDVSFMGSGQDQGRQGLPPAPQTVAPLLGVAPPEGPAARSDKAADGRRNGPVEYPMPPTAAEKPAPTAGEATLPGLDEPTLEAKAKAVQQADAGLASLDFELPSGDPSRWTLYRFTTPRGDEQISIRNISNDLARRLVEIVIVAAALLVLWIVVGMVRRGRFHWLKNPVAATLLLSFGVLSLCGGLLPIVGVVALVAGFGVLIQRWTSPPVTNI